MKVMTHAVMVKITCPSLLRSLPFVTDMDGTVVFLLVAMGVQFYSAVDDVRSLLVGNDNRVGHLQSLSANTVGAVSTLLTVVRRNTHSRVRQSFQRVEQSLQTSSGGGGDGVGYRNRVWLLALAAVVFSYLKHGQLVEYSDVEQTFYDPVVSTALQTVSEAGKYYTTFVFVDHVLLAKRVLCKLNAQITETASPISGMTGFTVSDARLAYLNICDGCMTVTRTFQTQLFVNIVGNVFGVTFMTLSAFNKLMIDGAENIRITLYFLYDSLVRIMQMYFIIDTCHITTEQANFINITFQKKINEYYQINITKRKVQLFILEMLDYKIEFIIYGFISLNFEMFVSIMGTIATYLLILVQLGSSSNVLEKTNATTVSQTSQ